MRAQQVVLAILLCLVCAGVTFAQSAPALPPLQPAQTSPAKSCAEYAVPQQIVASKTQGNGYLYSSVCVRPYKPDLEYAKNQTPVGETRDGFSQRNADPLFIIQMAYGRDVGEVLNVPDWLSAEAYDFEAKMDPATADALEKLSPDNRQLARQRMLQTLLEDQFNLEVHKEMRKIAAYDLIVAEGGPKFHEEAVDPRYPDGMCYLWESGANAILNCGPGRIDNLRGTLKFFLGHPVIDKTGLNGFYAFTLRFRTTPEAWVKTHSEEAKDTLQWAIVDQLGLFLEPVTISKEVTVVDHVEKPQEK